MYKLLESLKDNKKSLLRMESLIKIPLLDIEKPQHMEIPEYQVPMARPNSAVIDKNDSSFEL